MNRIERTLWPLMFVGLTMPGKPGQWWRMLRARLSARRLSRYFLQKQNALLRAELAKTVTCEACPPETVALAVVHRCAAHAFAPKVDCSVCALHRSRGVLAPKMVQPCTVHLCVEHAKEFFSGSVQDLFEGPNS